jgi:hypothetical protein
MRRLPIGIQSFEKLRDKGFVYVDKTALIYDMAQRAAGPVFLSRPRRFGKSLLCSTLKALFQGRRDLFKGLAIDSLDWDWKPYPVIHIDLNPADYTTGIDALEMILHNTLENNARNADIALRGEKPEIQLSNLLFDLHEKYKQRVAVIIDEYDKPLLNTIDDRKLHEQVRNALKGFYGVFKSADDHTTFVFLTGVTKFSKVSIFSDLNNLTDISLDHRKAAICGITQTEMEQNFGEEIETIICERNISRSDYLSDLKRFYNGYRFSRDPLTVYNPFGLLQHFHSGGTFDPYWFATGTPTFLFKLIENQHIDILHLEEEKITSGSFTKFDAENMSAVPVLYQSGYLTIVDYNDDDGIFSLGFPNEEVRTAFSKTLIEHYTHASTSADTLSAVFPSALAHGDIDTAMNALKIFLAAIPYDIQIAKEKYYQTIMHLVFRMFGFNCRSEVRIANGRIDTLVETKNQVFCFEFKLQNDDSTTATADDALRQIDSKEYLLPWSGSGKKLYKIGVSFDYEKRNIDEWKIATERHTGIS